MAYRPTNIDGYVVGFVITETQKGIGKLYRASVSRIEILNVIYHLLINY